MYAWRDFTRWVWGQWLEQFNSLQSGHNETLLRPFNFFGRMATHQVWEYDHRPRRQRLGCGLHRPRHSPRDQCGAPWCAIRSWSRHQPQRRWYAHGALRRKGRSLDAALDAQLEHPDRRRLIEFWPPRPRRKGMRTHQGPTAEVVGDGTRLYYTHIKKSPILARIFYLIFILLFWNNKFFNIF